MTRKNLANTAVTMETDLKWESIASGHCLGVHTHIVRPYLEAHTRSRPHVRHTLHYYLYTKVIE